MAGLKQTLANIQNALLYRGYNIHGFSLPSVVLFGIGTLAVAWFVAFQPSTQTFANATGTIAFFCALMGVIVAFALLLKKKGSMLRPTSRMTTMAAWGLFYKFAFPLQVAAVHGYFTGQNVVSFTI